MRFLQFLSVRLMLLATLCSSTAYGFPLFKDGVLADIYVSPKATVQVTRAVADLQNDIQMVSGLKPRVVRDLEQAGENVIIIASLNNPDTEALLDKRGLKNAKDMQGMFEAFMLKSVKNPASGVKRALTVIGSDDMGAVYGLYDISEAIGVSPLYWWADITPVQKQEIILDDLERSPKEPSVKYRGVFINDEEALTTWSAITSLDKGNGHPSPEVYKRIFEMLLRLKANAIWPAMMDQSNHFFEARDANGVPINPRLATDFGIYVGTSHCEQMGRNNLDEWYDWANAHIDMYDAIGAPKWDYTVNPKAIEAYWQERLDEAKDFNMIYTLGMRGVHDSPFLYENLEDPSLENKVELLQTIIDRQRAMIKETFGAEDAVPQVFIPYEEAAELYNGESTDGTEKSKMLELPDDVMMVWTEDNYGYTRQLPGDREKAHPGGNGLYYHFHYQGWPTTHDWLTTIPFTLVHEELKKAYDSEMNKIWMVNVGSVKPAELHLQFYMDMAYDINSHKKGETKKFLQEGAVQHFGLDSESAKEVAEIITEFNTLTWPTKPEVLAPFWGWNYEKDWLYRYYSLTDFGDEAQRQLNKALELEKRAKAIYESLDESAKKPYWHLSYYPIRSTRLMLEKMQYYRKNVLYAKQGRLSSVNAYKVLSEQAEAAIQADLSYYDEMTGGKWNGIMDPYAEYNFNDKVFDVANIP
ncbi:glycosyl hydrolase 115 family protein, partial [Agaribacterium haliotis]|uniref:glycosyl hydrolase 115 family protein n=1 Tax=Agaribacterium haliotis TaxID=2013869 RepID=UPI0018641C5B